MLEAARDLYGVAPGEFITARNQLVSQLKADGRTDDAATIAALRRPRLAEWALNRLAHTDPQTVARFAHAIAAAQQAQTAAIGGDATALRAATTELRDALNTVAAAAVRGLTADGGNGEAQRDDLTTILRQLVATADPSPLVAGVVGSGAIVSTGEFFPGAPDPASRPASDASTKAAPTEAAPAPAPAPAPEKPTAAAVRAMARAERLSLHQRAAAATARAAAATAALEQAQATLLERRRDLKTAQAAAAAAQAELVAFDAAHDH